MISTLQLKGFSAMLSIDDLKIDDDVIISRIPFANEYEHVRSTVGYGTLLRLQDEDYVLAIRAENDLYCMQHSSHESAIRTIQGITGLDEPDAESLWWSIAVISTADARTVVTVKLCDADKATQIPSSRIEKDAFNRDVIVLNDVPKNSWVRFKEFEKYPFGNLTPAKTSDEWANTTYNYLLTYVYDDGVGAVWNENEIDNPADGIITDLDEMSNVYPMGVTFQYTVVTSRGRFNSPLYRLPEADLTTMTPEQIFGESAPPAEAAAPPVLETFIVHVETLNGSKKRYTGVVEVASDADEHVIFTKKGDVHRLRRADVFVLSESRKK